MTATNPFRHSSRCCAGRGCMGPGRCPCSCHRSPSNMPPPLPPRVVTPQEAQAFAHADTTGALNRARYQDLAHTVATEPKRLLAEYERGVEEAHDHFARLGFDIYAPDVPDFEPRKEAAERTRAAVVKALRKLEGELYERGIDEGSQIAGYHAHAYENGADYA